MVTPTLGTHRDWGLGRYTTGERDLAILHPDHPGGPLVIVCHGALAGATFYDPTDRRKDLGVLAQAGCVVAVTDLGGDLCGNDDAFTVIDDIRSYAETDHGADPNQIGFVADSLGAMTALNYHWRNPEVVRASALRAPVVAADAIHDRDPGGVGALIDAAYDNDWDTARPDRDPTANAAAIAAIRDDIRIYYSANDPVVLPADIDTFATVCGLTRSTQVRSLGDVAHDPELIYPRIPARRQAAWLLRRLNA